MTDTQPTATVAGQSIALHITGYPDLPNRWGSGHIRATGIRLDYGNSHTPNGRHALVTGTWVREDGEVTTDPIDRYYDAHDGDTSDWPDWLAQLVKAHDPSAVPVSSPPPDQTALREAIDGALHRVLDSNLGKGAWTRLRAKATDAVLAVLPPPADRAAICRGLADQQTQLAVADDLARRRDMAAARRQLVKELLRLAAEAQQPATDTEHTPEPAQEA